MKVVSGILMIFTLLLSDCQEKVFEVNSSDGSITPLRKISLWNGSDFTGWEFFLSDSSTKPENVWKVQNGVIYCLGFPNGYMKTKESYSNYKLTLEWRWVAEPSNSGVLLNLSGEDNIWPKCIEAQLMHQNAGDFWLMEGISFSNLDSNHSIRSEESSEKSAGEWNQYEIICSDSSIILYVNGIMQNKGENPSVKSGRIGFQSEGTPIEFRNIFIEPLKK